MRWLAGFLAAVALCVPASISGAGEAGPHPYVLTLPAEDINLIFWALGKQPYEAVAPLIEKIRAQVQRQNAGAAAAPGAAAPPHPAPPTAAAATRGK